MNELPIRKPAQSDLADPGGSRYEAGQIDRPMLLPVVLSSERGPMSAAHDGHDGARGRAAR